MKPGDTVLDIGSNDCTSLKAYSTSAIHRIGVDPTGAKFKSFYPEDIKLVEDFFSAAAFRKCSSAKAKIVTSVAMFYDLDDPISFAREVESILAPDGIWHFEQSYMPSMLRLGSYDTICHEHLEFYSLAAVKRILDAADLQMIDVIMNSVNGGSFAVTAAKKTLRPSRRTTQYWSGCSNKNIGWDCKLLGRIGTSKSEYSATARICAVCFFPWLPTESECSATAPQPRGTSFCSFAELQRSKLRP